MAKTIQLDKIVHVISKEDLEIPEPHIVIDRRGEAQRYCAHEHVNVYPYYRKVYCKDCGTRLDAFDYLMHLGAHENIQFSNRIWIIQQIKRLVEERDNLKKEIAKLKAEKRKEKNV